jgi:hypothetical protein
MENTFNLSDLASLPEKSLLDERTLAKAFGVSTRTIKRWVQRGDLCSPTRMGARNFWLAGRIRSHVEDRFNAAEAVRRRRSEACKRQLTP